MARMKVSDTLKHILASLSRRPKPLRVRVIPSMKKLPSSLGNDLFIVGAKSGYKWAILSCPCGCGERIDICLMPSSNPRWELSLRKKRASLTPSIWVPAERCGSHFWIRDNRIVWYGRYSWPASPKLPESLRHQHPRNQSVSCPRRSDR